MNLISTTLGRLRSSQHPIAKRLRTEVKRSRALTEILRIASGSTVEAPKVSADIRLSTLLEARFSGGGLTLADLNLLWQLRGTHPHVFCIGEDATLDQIEVVLRSGESFSITRNSLHPLPNPAYLRGFDLVIAAPDAEARASVERLKAESGLGSNFVILADDQSRRSPYTADKIPQSKNVAQPAMSLRSALDNDCRVRVVLLNDVGFQYGAGIAQRRQATSLLLNGWDVAVMAWAPGNERSAPLPSGIQNFKNWHGVHALQGLSGADGNVKATGIDDVVTRVGSFKPDVVIVGNIHGANWPIELLSRLQDLGALVVAYMHDCYFVTGRCAYPGRCISFRTGCDELCPTADEYPRLDPSRIANAWNDRGRVFTGKQPVPLIANSNWTRGIALQRFGDAARSDVVHLGLDEALFAPVDKRTARDLLDIPQDKLVIAMGAVDMENQWKGGPVFRAVYQALQDRGDLEILLFGRASENYTSARAFGLVRDERLMPLIYGAADIFVSTGTEEAFGQTLLEASACGLPVVAFNVGGVSDVIVDQHSGLLVNTISAADLIRAVENLIQAPELRALMGQNGRKRAETEFSLARQAESWKNCLKRLA